MRPRVDCPPERVVPVYIHGSWAHGVSPMFLRALVRVSYQCLGLHLRLQRVFLSSQYSPGLENGHPLGGVMTHTSSFGKVG